MVYKNINLTTIKKSIITQSVWSQIVNKFYQKNKLFEKIQVWFSDETIILG
jgi:hypothetical protein